MRSLDTRKYPLEFADRITAVGDEKTNQPSISREKFFRVTISLVMMLIGPARTARAAEPSPGPSNYIRTRFGSEQGFPSDVVDDIVQSHDGFLWLRVNALDITRFDGQHFIESGGLGVISSLAVAPDGDLWVGTSNSLKHIPAGDLDQPGDWHVASYSLDPAQSIIALHFTRKGELWVGTNRGLYRFEHGVFLPAIPGRYIERVDEARNGHLWIRTPEGPIEWDGSHALPHPELEVQLGVKAADIFHVFEDSHGVTWFCTKYGVARRVGGTIEKLQPYDSHGHQAYRVYEDPRGRIWFAKEEGLVQWTADGLRLVAEDMKVRRMFGDRDGNLWVGTNGDGLYRFKDLAVRTYTTADGLPSKIAMTVLAAHDGSLWAGFNCGGIAHFDGRGFRIYNQKDGLVNDCVWGLAEDFKHDLWIGTWGGGVFSLHDGRFTQYSKAQGLSGDVVKSIVPARDGSIWLAVDAGVSRIRDGQIRNYTSADGLFDASYYKVYEDRQGGIWAEYPRGAYHLVGDRFEKVTFPERTRILVLGEDLAGALYFSCLQPNGIFGIIRKANDQSIQVASGFGAVHMAATKLGELWLVSNTGLYRFPPGSLDHPHRPDEPVDYELFGVADGMPAKTSSAGIPIVAQTPDDKLWIGTNRGLASVDQSTLSWSDRKPTIYIEKVTVGRDSVAGPHELVLPAGTHHLELNFDAIELTSPEKIRLQYRMDGVDSEWLDANPPGQATYSTLPPGNHSFHIRACNKDGIWDRAGMVYSITQQPYFYQKSWFIAASVAFGLFLIAGLYRLRIRQVVARMDIRLEERVSERTRIARELHDTLLQSFHGLMFQYQAARNLLPQKPQNAMQVLDDTILSTEQAIAEGRDAIRNLRPESMAQRDLAQLLTAAGHELAEIQGAKANSPDFRVIVEGEPRNLSPILQDETYRIAREAIRNAFRHADASRIEVEIRYDAQQLRLRIRDDGKGIEPKAIQSGGSPGHWGIPGIRERAQRIGARLDLWSEAGAGTEVELKVPAAIAYAKQRRPSRFRLFRKAGSDERNV